jgi:hypothetical protein
MGGGAIVSAFALSVGMVDEAHAARSRFSEECTIAISDPILGGWPSIRWP